MDVKALAKSKRAHSQHHSKKHQPPESSKPSSVASDNKKPTGKQAKGKAPHSNVAKPLPSNWERYAENLDINSEEALTSSSQPTEFVLPKSKGADYAHLISEAKDQSRSNHSTDVSQFFDDVITDFTQDFGPMLLAAKGRSILSWAADDDFELDGKTSSSLEAPFLSLNLNALAEQLAKAKLSQRCFLDPDRFPSELLDELQACETHTSAAETGSRFSSLDHNRESGKNSRQNHEPSFSTLTVTSDHHPMQTPGRASEPINQENIKISQSQKTNRSISPDKSPHVFQATSAEAELDMLLSSFGESKKGPSSSSISFPSTSGVSGGNGKNRDHVMKPAIIDDDIDKLLEETSGLMVLDGKRGSDEVRAIADGKSSAFKADSKSKFMDDFDSWLDTI